MPAIAFKPTDEQRLMVRNMSAAGIVHERIAAGLGIDDKTLRKHFRAEIDLAQDQLTARAVGQLARAIDRGEAWAICFYLKCRAGWQERQLVQVEGEVNIVGILRERFAKAQTLTGTVEKK